MDSTWIFNFGDGQADGGAHLKDRLGNKGANLAEMTLLKLRVPPGFTIPTDVCSAFYAAERQLPPELMPQVEQAMSLLETRTGKKFGDPKNPLLISVRSGGAVSMPGMMDTILNLGLNDVTVKALAAKAAECFANRSNDVTVEALATEAGTRFAYECYARFISMYSETVLKVDSLPDIRDDYKAEKGVKDDRDLNAEQWQELVKKYKKAIEEETGSPFPQDIRVQLTAAIGAVLESWMSTRAISYRLVHDIPENLGTAVSVQAMVFGNMGPDCATGIACSRTDKGEKRPAGDYRLNAQGEAVVSGDDPTDFLTEAGKILHGSSKPSFEARMPAAYGELKSACDIMEKHYRDAQEIEFTVENGTLWLLQGRQANHGKEANLRTSVELAEDGIITKAEAIKRVGDFKPPFIIDPQVEKSVFAKGTPASPDAVWGRAVFDSDEAQKLAGLGLDVILCRESTDPSDIHGIDAARGVITSRGGRKSHAARVVAGMWKPCIVGVSEMTRGFKIDCQRKIMQLGDHIVNEGDILTMDGASGEIVLGKVPLVPAPLTDSALTLMRWARDARANAKVEIHAPVCAK